LSIKGEIFLKKVFFRCYPLARLIGIFFEVKKNAKIPPLWHGICSIPLIRLRQGYGGQARRGGFLILHRGAQRPQKKTTLDRQ
jgi:hypothetical protein